jgi:1-acyl-sn-glycerol-3-phosphate acyltransferase
MFPRFLARTLRLFYGWLELAFFTEILYLLSYLPRKIIRPFYFNLFRLWCKVFVNALGVELNLHEKNLNPIPDQYILISNHPSSFEDVGIPALFPVYSLAKAEVADWWWAGRIVSAADNLFVKRESRESRRNAAEQITEAVKQGKSICIYPEGGCKGRRIFESFRYGAFDISLKTGVPILPVFLHYEAQDTFEWRAPFTLLQTFWRIMMAQNRRVNFYRYDAIYPDQFNSKEEYNTHIHQLYLQWQARYLD